MKPTMTLRGIPGLGDEIQQRAIIRALLPRFNVRLATTWPCVYHDFIDQGGLSVYRRPVGLRMQAQNAVRDVEQARFSRAPQTPYQVSGTVAQIYYNGRVERTPSHTVLEAMFQSVGIAGDYKDADFRMPVRPGWFDDADRLIDGWKPQKPILVYRPPIFRVEAPASGVRNPNPAHYAEIAAMLRDSFFVVSVAALAPSREHIVGPILRPDADLTHGELVFDTMAALFARASMVLTPGGFPAILASAVETPCINIMGGYQPAAWMADCGKFSPYLGIDTKSPCECYSSTCRRLCLKEIDLAAARPRVLEFAGLSAAETRPASEMHDPNDYAPRRQHAPMLHPNITHYPAVRPVLRRPPVRA